MSVYGNKRFNAKNKVNSIKSLIEGLNFSTEKSMQILKIPIEKQELYYKLVNDPVFYEKYFADDSNFIDPSDYENFDEDNEEEDEEEEEEDEE